MIQARKWSDPLTILQTRVGKDISCEEKERRKGQKEEKANMDKKHFSTLSHFV
jgi:hypothetical protein